ncbi:MAG: PIG-L family deacetylase [Elusimicrobiales bacterium]|nr:PIG-L family deacetylase [Elusimicrobiales bacterium]
MNILAIGAHFDDIELGCGGTVAKHVSKGDKVFAFVATRSGFVSHNQKVVRTNAVAYREGRKAIGILGAELIRGNFDTLKVEFEEELNTAILKIVEEKRIERVYTHWTGDVHHDHVAVARSSLHSCRHVPDLFMYRSNWYHGSAEFRGNFYVDVTRYFDLKIAATKAHISELNRTHSKWLEFFANEAANAGQRIGVRYAEVFELVKCLDR